MWQLFGFMKIMEELLLEGKKRRTSRAFSKFRDRCKIGDIMRIYTGLRTKNCKKLFNARVVEKLYWNIDDAPGDQKLAKKLESPKKGETWEEFALRDGFDFYSDFLSYFKDHPKKTKKFIFFRFTTNLMEEYNIPNNMKITMFIGV